MSKHKCIELELEVLDVKAELKIKRLRGLVSGVGMALMGAAIFQELRKPVAERVWHGRLWGRVPYEFRLPTVERLRQAYWAPDDGRIFTDTPFGVGWSLNLGRLVRACSSGCMKGRGATRATPTTGATKPDGGKQAHNSNLSMKGAR